MAPECLWNGKGWNQREQSPAKLAALLGKSRRTVYRELGRRMTDRLTNPLEKTPYYSGELARVKADEQKQNHGPAEKTGYDQAPARAIADKIKNEHYSP
jgi:IS30 family transposase